MAAGTGAREAGPGEGVPGSAVENPYAERRSVVLDGYKVRYWFYDVDRAPKPLLVMVHGFRGDHHGLQLLADRLRSRYHVVVPDLPGFGRSERFPDRRHDVAGYVEFLRRFVAELTGGAVRDGGAVGDGGGRRGIVVLGHSFGSVVAAHFAAAHPGMVERLVLVNPLGLNDPVAEGTPYAPLDTLLAQAEELEAASHLVYITENTIPDAAAQNALRRFGRVSILACGDAAPDGGVVFDAERYAQQLQTLTI